jgi:hypothetical protein
MSTFLALSDKSSNQNFKKSFPKALSFCEFCDILFTDADLVALARDPSGTPLCASWFAFLFFNDAPVICVL